MDQLCKLLDTIYGYDFSQYSKASLKRRMVRVMMKDGLEFYPLKQEIINNPAFVDKLVMEITVNVTEMFRDPEFFATIRSKVFPYLMSFPRLKVWHAGCSTGEEVYSLAILLEEAGLYNKSFLYGTDINAQVLDKARKGIYSLKQMRDYSENYIKSQATNSLANYYTAAYEAAAIHQGLKKNTLFALHNLATDNVFNEFELILCRNVLIYFETSLQTRVISLLLDSLRPLGFLCLGPKEFLRNEQQRKRLKIVDQRFNIYQKID